jgi:hypothetical protein
MMVFKQLPQPEGKKLFPLRLFVDAICVCIVIIVDGIKNKCQGRYYA